MVRKVTTLLVIGGALAIAACNTVRGAGEDCPSAANCTENAITRRQLLIDVEAKKRPRRNRLRRGLFLG
jgi:predicted small secreted protein